jgi:diketogulonate reductase-like aldo/keto reductase
MTDTPPQMDRRNILGAAALLSASGTIASGPVLAQAPARLAPASGATNTTPAPVITRIIPSSNEAIPALGLGTFLVFDQLPGARREALREVVRIHHEAGTRVIDTSPLYGNGETNVGHAASALGINDQIFVADKVWATGDFLADESQARRSLETSRRVLWRDVIDVMHVHSLVNVDIVLPLLRAWKREGLIRYTAISHYENPYHEILTGLVRQGNLDVVQVNYSIFNRAAEERLLPAARDAGVAVFTNMPFEKARLFQVVQGRALPDFAREFGARNWAQFFLKWVMGNPAVTCVLAGTSDPAHAAENVGALTGPLPDAAMRQRMLRFMEGLPGFDRIASVPWYPEKGELYQGVIRQAQGRLRQRLG